MLYNNIFQIFSDLNFTFRQSKSTRSDLIVVFQNFNVLLSKTVGHFVNYQHLTSKV